MNQDLMAAVEELRNQIENTNQVEYGDFKRKVGGYLVQFQKRSGSKLSPAQTKALKNMIQYVVYTPNFSIDQTLDQLRSDLEGAF